MSELLARDKTIAAFLPDKQDSVPREDSKSQGDESQTHTKGRRRERGLVWFVVAKGGCVSETSDKALVPRLAIFHLDYALHLMNTIVVYMYRHKFKHKKESE